LVNTVLKSGSGTTNEENRKRKRERDNDTDSLEDRIDSIEKSAKVERVKYCDKMKVAKGKVNLYLKCIIHFPFPKQGTFTNELTLFQIHLQKPA
jgi:hypothetical protein